jgi:hypothetical protein
MVKTFRGKVTNSARLTCLGLHEPDAREKWTERLLGRFLSHNEAPDSLPVPRTACQLYPYLIADLTA